MTDSFAVFGLLRRPLVDEAILKEKYLRLAARLHPDSSGGDADGFAALREAMEILENPSRRLRHLIALEFPGQGRSVSAPANADLFVQVGEAIREARTLLEKRQAAKSVLGKALLAENVRSVLAKLETLARSVEIERTGVLGRLRELDARWPDEVTPAELEAAASDWLFLNRWGNELSEWTFKLSHE